MLIPKSTAAIPDASTGDATGSHAGQKFTEKVKDAVKGVSDCSRAWLLFLLIEFNFLQNVGSDAGSGKQAKDDTTQKVEEASGGGIIGKTEGLSQNQPF